jgi:hypothetical protein
VAKGFPRKLQMRLRGVEPGGRTVKLGLYTVDHEFSV